MRKALPVSAACDVISGSPSPAGWPDWIVGCHKSHLEVAHSSSGCQAPVPVCSPTGKLSTGLTGFPELPGLRLGPGVRGWGTEDWALADLGTLRAKSPPMFVSISKVFQELGRKNRNPDSILWH